MINPDAGNLGGKVGFVFFGFGVPLCIAFWFLIPETKGLTFEDVSIPPGSGLFLFSLFYSPYCVGWLLIRYRWITCSRRGFLPGISRGKDSVDGWRSWRRRV